MTPNNPTTEELLLDETFLNFYFKKNEDDCMDWEERIEEDPALARKATEAFEMLERAGVPQI
jgi:transmembrane sensor